MLAEEPLVVGVEEQILVLANRLVQVGPLRPPRPVDALSVLAHLGPGGAKSLPLNRSTVFVRSRRSRWKPRLHAGELAHTVTGMTAKMPSALFWKLPYGLRRSLRMLIHPRKYRQLGSMRTAEPEQLNVPTFKPFIERRRIFVHTPKAAGTTIGYGLFGRHTGNHTTIADYQLAFNRQEFDSFFKFTFVRNPWDRLVSAFHFMRGGGRNEGDRQWAETHLSGIDTFEEFVLRWVNRTNIYKGLHVLPQYEFITTPGSRRPLVDFIGHFEDIDADYSRIRDRLGGGAVLACDNKTSGRQSDYRSCYSDRTREIVAEVYREDIELLGYDFENR